MVVMIAGGGEGGLELVEVIAVLLQAQKLTLVSPVSLEVVGKWALVEAAPGRTLEQNPQYQELESLPPLTETPRMVQGGTLKSKENLEGVEMGGHQPEMGLVPEVEEMIMETKSLKMVLQQTT